MSAQAGTRPTRWAVVGLGRFARGRLLPALLAAPGARLAGVYTRDPEIRRAVAAEYGVTAYDAYDAALSDPQVDVVGLVTPHDLHAPQALAAAEAGKHVFVEKPMALTVPDAVKMLEASNAAGRGLYVGFHLRFHQAHRHVRELIRSGRLGDLVWISAKWAAYREPDTGWRLDPALSGGTLLTARGVHLLDLIRFVTGGEFRTISGVSDGFRAEHPADDVTAAVGALSCGAVAHLLCSRLVPGSDDGLEVFGTHGTLVCHGVLSNDTPSSLVLREGRNETVQGFPKIDMLAAELGGVSAAVAGSVSPDTDVAARGVDGMRVTAVTAALVQSIRSGRIVQAGG